MRAEGTGQGTLTVVTVYNAKIKEDESECKKFDLRVSVENIPRRKELPLTSLLKLVGTPRWSAQDYTGSNAE